MSGAFRNPDVLHFRRRCRDCGEPWCVDCAFGAEEPPRDPYYRCPLCRTPTVELSDARLAALGHSGAQLALVRDEEVVDG